MKLKLLFTYFLISLSYPVFAQNTVKMTAVKGNDYGVAYSLPKTEIVVAVSYTKTKYKAGEYAQYANVYLSIPNPIKEDKTVFRLDKIEAATRGIVDKDKSYLVEFKSGTTAPFVTLSKDGLICAINDDYTLPTEEKTEIVSILKTEVNPRNFLSEEILRAGSTSRQAELIAKQIYRLRESRNNILTGEADNMPPDGNAYKVVIDQLEEQEKALTAMFTGTESIEIGQKEIIVLPADSNMVDYVICRFSTKLGVVDANDYSGAPVYLSLTNKEPKKEVYMTLKEEKALAEKFSKGIIYNIPGKGQLKITFNNKNYIDKEFDIVQYGVQEVLAPKMFDNNKQPIKVLFYPELGSIKQIIQ